MVIKIDQPDSGKLIKKPIIPALMLLSVIIIGTIGYYFFFQGEDRSLVDAFYMVAITITTVGFTEVIELDKGGRLFTIIISFLGIGSLFYMFGVIMENFFIYQQLNVRGRKKMLSKIKDMEDHYIIVGFGRVGTLTASELRLRNEEFVVIDTKIDTKHSTFEENEIIAIEGDATEDETLMAAGIEKAKGLIVATGNAAVTVFVVISARAMNPNLNIVARSDEESSNFKLIKAGANRIVNPYQAGGYKLASVAVNPAVVDFFDSGSHAKGFNLEMIEVPEGSNFIGKDMKELDLRNKTGVTVVAIVDSRGEIKIPDGTYKIKIKDKLMAAGTIKQLQEIEKIIY